MPFLEPALAMFERYQESMNDEHSLLIANKNLARRYNQEILQEGNPASADELFAPGFVNRTAPPGMPAGREGILHTFDKILRPALAGLRVEIHDQIAEGDKVTTRKSIHGTHTGELLGVPATGKPVTIDVIDILRFEGGRVIEHWGQNTLPQVLAGLRAS